MNISIGIVGLPNIGKSTLFNALLKKTVADAANYPFCTIEPNVGVVEVPDPRLQKIAELVDTKKIVSAVIEFYDIAGLVAGASEGEGLGNKFLSHIREVAVIAHVVRLFEDENVLHVANSVDPLRDIKIIDTELALADLSTLEKQKDLSVAARSKATKEEILRADAVIKLKKHLNEGKPARTCPLTPEELQSAHSLQLLTMKPVIYVFNVSEEQLTEQNNTELKILEILNSVGSTAATPNTIYLNAKLENDVLALSINDQEEYLSQYGLKETGLNRLIKKAYETLGLISFLTGGQIEARAWTIKKGTPAPVAAGTIHTDFEKKFIKAEIVHFNTFVEVGGWSKARELGKVQIVGRDYEMQDGDVVDFKIGA
jgi:hypothetical protein